MKQVPGKDLARVLKRHGWKLARIQGSHHIFVKEGSVVRLSVPVHSGKTLKTGLLSHLLKQAGLTEKELL